MEFGLFPSLNIVAFSIFTGFVFGFLLRKATVSRTDVIWGQLILKDFTVMKVILSAIITGALGTYTLSEYGILNSFYLSTVPGFWAFVGGGIFGIGMALAGLCPGTTLAAIGERSKPALVTFFGLLVGASIYNVLPDVFHYQDSLYKQTLSTYFGISPFVVVGILLAGLIALAMFTKKQND